MSLNFKCQQCMKTVKKSIEQLIPCLVIYAVVNGRKTYVSGQCTRSDNKYLCTFNENVKKAKPFTSEQEVEVYKKKIFSLYIKQFHHEPAELPAASFAAVDLKKVLIQHQ
jgi:hypothetical protein